STAAVTLEPGDPCLVRLDPADITLWPASAPPAQAAELTLSAAEDQSFHPERTVSSTVRHARRRRRTNAVAGHVRPRPGRLRSGGPRSSLGVGTDRAGA